MDLICVDQEKCIKCGMCINVCPNILEMEENGPKAKYPELCIGCGQCVAVCPQAAIDNERAPLSNQISFDQNLHFNSKAATQFLRSRRSIRHYKQASVPHGKLLELINIARFAPTAGNGQGVSCTIIEDKDILKKAVELTYKWMESMVVGSDTVIYRSFAKHIQMHKEKGNDTILRDAPHIILATTPKDMPRGRENTIFSLAYLELYAPSLGLGSCWAGLLEMCLFDRYQPLLDLFNIPQDKEITGAVMIGYPLYRYQRMVDRNPIEVDWL
ncbi:MAG: nitroreductase family protein [Pelosinus sp.]|nr:nitroreductase family protein [Pelosinus sp.]